jgi:hypothetical protein
MDIEALFSIVKSWGPSAVTSLLVFFVIHLSKKLDKNGEEDKLRADNLKIYLEDKLKGLREDTTKVLDEHGRRISCIELEYVRRMDFYKDLGGWRDDINRLYDKISSVSTDLSKSINELWKDRAR